jgi:RES domain
MSEVPPRPPAPSRAVVAQQSPRVPLDGFPVHTVVPDTPVFRAHTAGLGPWWFGNDGCGRFDLPAPRGTCYVATSAVAAVRERIGVVLGGSATVPAALLEGVVVSRLRPPERRRVADLEAARAADFGVTRELETMVPYDVPQAWARAFAAVDLGGVRYAPRFTTGPALAVALFGPAGDAGWPDDPAPLPARDVPGAPLAMPPPRRMDLTVVRPPRTRTRRPG